MHWLGTDLKTAAASRNSPPPPLLPPRTRLTFRLGLTDLAWTRPYAVIGRTLHPTRNFSRVARQHGGAPWATATKNVKKPSGKKGRTFYKIKFFTWIQGNIFDFLKDRICILFFRPRTFLQCFALYFLCSKAKHCRNVLGRVLGQKNKLHPLSLSWYWDSKENSWIFLSIK